MKTMGSVVSQLMSPQIYKQMKQVYMVIFFYALVVALSGTVGYAVSHKDGLHQGLIAGVVISAILWYQYGQYYV